MKGAKHRGVRKLDREGFVGIKPQSKRGELQLKEQSASQIASNS